MRKSLGVQAQREGGRPVTGKAPRAEAFEPRGPELLLGAAPPEAASETEPPALRRRGAACAAPAPGPLCGLAWGRGSRGNQPAGRATLTPNLQMQPTGRTVPSSARALAAVGDPRNVGLCGRGPEGLQLICIPLGGAPTFWSHR